MDDIKENFNGKIFIEKDCYFFDVNNDVLRIFFNQTGIDSVREFNKTHSDVIKKGWLYGICEDRHLVAFGIKEVCMSDNPDVYAEYKLIICVKDQFGCGNLKNRDIKTDFNVSFTGMRISGKLINKICLEPLFFLDLEFNPQMEDKLSLCKVIIPKKEIQLNNSINCLFEVNTSLDEDNQNQIIYNASIVFNFIDEKNVEDILSIYRSIKNFVDLLCLARNTNFNIELLRGPKQNEKHLSSFADVKIYENYRNYCNRPETEYIKIKSIENNISKIFNNLSDEKYSLCFLPIDNDDYNKTSYSDIQNLITAVELASDLKSKTDGLDKSVRKKIKDWKYYKAGVLFDWCNPYKKLLKEKYPSKKGVNNPYYYILEKDDIYNFRELRHEITHKAMGTITIDNYNCYLCLRYVLCNYILGIDGNNDSNSNIVRI